LAKLPSRQREALVLFELSGFSLDEIRQLQGGTLSGVKSRMKRGREQLRRWLDPPEGTGQEGRKARGKVKSEEGKNEK
jgi:RNA polymerase sigma-70 factor (ECF subfamily)